MGGRSIGALLCVLVFSSCVPDNSRTSIIVFHAGSLSLPLMELEAAFEAEYPEYDVQREAAGSRTCARKISDLNQSCDVFLSADDDLIQSMLIPDHAAWSIPFATNELCLVYQEGRGLKADQKTFEWMEVLAQNGLRIGRSDPDSDPCGYRTILVLQLADLEIEMDFSSGILKRSERTVRPKSADLIAMLETGALDAAFMYRSVAEQHGLKYISFPHSVGLGNLDMSAHYATVSVDVAGDTPDVSTSIVGSPIVYGLTIPVNATEVAGAEKFIAFLLSDDGATILKKNHQAVLEVRSAIPGAIIPDSLKPFVQE